jgi:hypothetical protein
MGFKKPSNAFYSKATVMSTKRNTHKKSISGLKSSRRVFLLFSGEDPSMEQINGHRVSQSRGVARGLAHGLIP